MDATPHDIELLHQLQEVDRRVTTAQKELDSLPHRQAILNVRAKKEEIVKKKVQLQDMLDEAEGQLAEYVAEDEKLSAKQDQISEKLIEVKDDYRAVASHTRELDGVRKRREKISVGLAKVEEQVNKINPVMKQVMEGLAALEAKERDLIDSFQKTGGQLKQAIADGGRLRKDLVASLDAELFSMYEKKRERLGGVALADLKGEACSACRSAFDQSRLIKIRSQAPVAICPSCGRLLVVKE